MKQSRSLWTLTLALLVGMFTLGAYAQQPDASPGQQYPSQPTAQQPGQPGQQPGQMPDQTSPSQAPDQTAPSAQQPAAQTPGAQDQSGQPAANAAGTQMFSGTIVKSGDKYVFQDAASGKTYDIDHQDQVKNYEGKRVRVKGTLDSNNTIHIQ